MPAPEPQVKPGSRVFDHYRPRGLPVGGPPPAHRSAARNLRRRGGRRRPRPGHPPHRRRHHRRTRPRGHVAACLPAYRSGLTRLPRGRHLGGARRVKPGRHAANAAAATEPVRHRVSGLSESALRDAGPHADALPVQVAAQRTGQRRSPPGASRHETSRLARTALTRLGLAQTGLPGEITPCQGEWDQSRVPGFAPYAYDAGLLGLPTARALVKQVGRQADVVV
jgi:hypothetical protein